ncbi:BTB POZ domain-containing protein [Rutstroemia sp. NJR-2017a WRK4]|nr:BTB POZ domain-containing protein [Rutstroemia sp. NJR-2017a WRK4]
MTKPKPIDTPETSEQKPLNYYFTFPETVKIIVGTERKCWTLHKELVCQRSEHFRAAFQSNFIESNGVLILEDEDPKIFAYVIDWLYGVDGTRLVILPKLSTSTMVYFKIYVVVDRYCLEKLKLAVIECLRPPFSTRMNFCPKIDDVLYLYEHTQSLKNDPARKFLVDSTLQWVLAPPSTLPDMLPGLAECNLEFSRDLILATRSHLLLAATECRLLKCSVHKK